MRWRPTPHHDYRPMRGVIRFEGGLRDQPIVLNRETPEGARTVREIELDGVRYVPAPIIDWDGENKND